MNRTVVALFVALFVTPVLAGCLGGDDVKTGDDDGCGVQCDLGGQVQEGFGRITGRVMDTSFEPVAGANVTLREHGLTTRSDSAGRYAFNNLAPGNYMVYANNPPTHAADSRQIAVEAGVESNLDLQLEILPPPAQPYFLEFEGSGSIGCSVAYDLIEARDRCEHDPNAQSEFEVPLAPMLSSLVFMLETGTSPIGTSELHVYFIRPAEAFGQVRGGGTLHHRVDIDEDNAWVSWESPPPILFNVRANSAASMPQVAYQQPISWYMGLFYHGEPVPDNYTPKGDA